MWWSYIGAELGVLVSCVCMHQLLSPQRLAQQRGCQLWGWEAATACMLGTLPAPLEMLQVPCLEAFQTLLLRAGHSS